MARRRGDEDERPEGVGDATDPAASSRRKGIQSIETGFRILDHLMVAGRPQPLREIAAGTGMPPSKLSFYLISLVAVGMVRQDPDTGHYALGPHALKLGLASLEQFDLFSSARATLVELAGALGHTVFLGVWGNRGPTIVNRVDGPQGRAVFDLRVGSVLPVLRSALGRNFLAHMPRPLTEPILSRELGESAALGPLPSGARLPSTSAEIDALIAEVRRDGISRARALLLSDFTAISAPIFDHAGMILAGVTVMGPIGSFDDDPAGRPAQRLRQATCDLSIQVGWFPPA